MLDGLLKVGIRAVIIQHLSDRPKVRRSIRLGFARL